MSGFNTSIADASAGDESVLSSRWDGLSSHLLASFWAVERSANGASVWTRVKDSPTVRAPLTEANLDMTLGWQSPFENIGADKVAPSLSAMLQSGAIQPWISPVPGGSDFFRKVEGRSGITKLNSTQVFAGMQPLKISLIALFRAWADPKKEVEDPVNQLIEWALPQELAKNGPLWSLLGVARDALNGRPITEASALAALPSIAPTKIAFNYKNRTYSPLVIESISQPINSHVDEYGRYIEMLIPMTLCSLTAIDQSDWKRSGDKDLIVGGFVS